MEPLTHRLTTIASVIPCTAGFQSRYKDLLERWFAVTPRLTTVSRPSEIHLSDATKLNKTKDYSFATGGIYSSEELRQLQRYLEFPRVQNAITYKLAEQAIDIRPETYISPLNLFPPGSLPSGSWHSFILGKFWGAIKQLGEVASIFVGVFLLTKTAWGLFKICANGYHLFLKHGISPQLLWACCIEVLFIRLHAMANRRGPQNRRRDTFDLARQQNMRRMNDDPGVDSFSDDDDPNQGGSSKYRGETSILTNPPRYRDLQTRVDDEIEQQTAINRGMPTPRVNVLSTTPNAPEAPPMMNFPSMIPVTSPDQPVLTRTIDPNRTVDYVPASRRPLPPVPENRIV